MKHLETPDIIKERKRIVLNQPTISDIQEGVDIEKYLKSIIQAD